MDSINARGRVGSMRFLVTILVNRPGRPVLPSLSRIRCAPTGPTRLCRVSNGACVGYSRKQFIFSVSSCPMFASGGHCLQKLEEAFQGCVVGGSLRLTHSVSSQPVRDGGGLEEAFCSKLTTPIRMIDASGDVTASNDGVSLPIDGRAGCHPVSYPIPDRV